MKNICLAIALLLAAAASNAQSVSPFPSNVPFAEMEYLKKLCAKFALDESPNVVADTNLIAIWKMQEDVDEHNYFVMERTGRYEFVFTYMNRGGSNRTYENVKAFFSKIGNATFLNVPIYDRETDAPGFFFLKVTGLDVRGWEMTLALVDDPTLKDLPSREAVRERIAKHIDDASYFAKPVHMHKKLPLMYCK